MDIYKIIEAINEERDLSQRKLAKKIGISLGKVNSLIRQCINNKWIVKKDFGNKISYEVTEKGFELLRKNIEILKEQKLSISKDSNEKVKTAVILAAGERKDFDVSPAGLTIGNTTIIEETIMKLKKNGIKKIIVVLGYGKDKILDALKNQEDIIFVESSTYRNSGSMNSLAQAKKYISEDFILIEGDVFFEERALKELISSEKRECILITEVGDLGDEEFIQLKDGYLFKLGKDIHQFNKINGEVVGLIKMSYKLFELMIKEYKDNMNPLLNYDYILLDVARNFKVSSLKIHNLIWGEVDDYSQYKRLKQNIEKL